MKERSHRNSFTFNTLIFTRANKDDQYEIFGFSIRWIPAKYREAQTDFFGKRGITWHITVVTRKKRQINSKILVNGDNSNQSSDLSDSMNESSGVYDDVESEIDSGSTTGKIIFSMYPDTTVVRVRDERSIKRK